MLVGQVQRRVEHFESDPQADNEPYDKPEKRRKSETPDNGVIITGIVHALLLNLVDKKDGVEGHR
ncbi:hypothetical protein [Chlorobaculum tepidum]|uniref:hypothetical protein n=1 Tax=Chlorobaculum tepidum TaxID=1097 RepID=UPI0013E8F08D|nr:hypothetical protein [Chlorobaculum tepidum]